MGRHREALVDLETGWKIANNEIHEFYFNEKEEEKEKENEDEDKEKKEKEKERERKVITSEMNRTREFLRACARRAPQVELKVCIYLYLKGYLFLSISYLFYLSIYLSILFIHLSIAIFMSIFISSFVSIFIFISVLLSYLYLY